MEVRIEQYTNHLMVFLIEVVKRQYGTLKQAVEMNWSYDDLLWNHIKEQESQNPLQLPSVVLGLEESGQGGGVIAEMNQVVTCLNGTDDFTTWKQGVNKLLCLINPDRQELLYRGIN